MPFRLQEFIHSLEEGGGRKIITMAVSIAAAFGLMAIFDTLLFRNMTTPEGMEMAQLARNIGEGKGYTTLVWRPLAIHLLQTHRNEVGMLVKESLPDIQNPPFYPVLLAGWLKLNPFSYRLPPGQNFTYSRPDLWVACFNQLLLIVAGFLIYRLATRLFDSTVGWMSAGLFFGTLLYWQMAFTGHATLLLVIEFLLLLESLFRAEEAAAAETPAPARVLLWASLAGVCVGLGALTRYSFLWLIIPVVAFFLLRLQDRRPVASVAALAAFLLVFSPWVVRNVQVSGTPFGTAGYVIAQGSEAFPEDELDRALYPRWDSYDKIKEVRRKVVTNVREIVGNQLPRMGGNWVGIFFLVGLLMPFRRPSLNRVRLFLVAAIGTLVVVQAGGQTTLSKENPEVSSENLLAIVAPAAFIFGAGVVFSLVSQFRLSPPLLQGGLLAAFLGVCCLPLILCFAPPLPYLSAVVYPPYYPPFLQRIGRMNDSGSASTWEKELVMTDVPTAMAWYSRCPAVMLTLNYRNDPADKLKDDFFELNDYRRTVKALYLTQRTLKTIPVKGVVDTGKEIRLRWENFIGTLMTKGKLPAEFPLQRWADGIWPEQLYAEFPPPK